MWHLDGPQAAPADLARMIAGLGDTSFFDRRLPLTIARAPGRLDLMGGIADYSGSLVLELPLALAAVAAVQIDDAPFITVRSLHIGDSSGVSEVRVALADLAPGGIPLDYAAAQALLGADPHVHWAAYLVGVALALAHERDAPIDRGLRILLSSDVPPGKGVSSSAAIEVATMRAVAALLGVELGGRTLAILCQKVENLIVGAPCGVMDQMTAACGEADALMALRCQPAELEPPVALPPDLEVWGIDSGIRHAVSGADYGSVRVGAFMGYRVIAELSGLRAIPVGDGRVTIEDPLYGGYLVNVGPSRWLQHFRDQLPGRIRGDAFLARYGGTTDAVTRIDPAREYAVRMPTEHPIHEHHRVETFRALLQGLVDDGRWTIEGHSAYGRDHRRRSPWNEQVYELLGELMYQSHASYSACGLGSDGTDRLVELVRASGMSAGLYGAKITGGGSGGTVAVLARQGSAAAVQAVADRYTHESGRAAMLIGGSSPGALASGVFEAVWED